MNKIENSKETIGNRKVHIIKEVKKLKKHAFYE